MMKITTNQISKLHQVFQFLDLDYYLNCKRVRECYIAEQGQPKSLLDIHYKQKREIEIIEDDLIQMQTFDDSFIEELLRASKDEILSNIYSVGEDDRLHYLDHNKMDLYSICKSIQLSDFLLNIRIDNKNYIELAENEKNIIDRYIETVSSLAYNWSYELHFIERQHRGYIPQKELIILRKGVLLKDNIIFDILFAYDYDSIENDNYEDEGRFIDIEELCKNKSWISFSEGTLNKFINGKTIGENEFIDWKYRGYKKADKAPDLKALALFCLVVISPIKRDNLKDQDLLKYIINRITLDNQNLTQPDKSAISKARKLKKDKEIQTIEDLIRHFEH